MPASIPISKHEKNWLLKIIQEVYGIQIVDAYSCQKLSEVLQQRARISISYNTLRRLFGIIKGQTMASRFTLDSLCKGLGYADFASFKQSANQFEKDFFNEMLILNRLQNRHNDQDILEIVRQFELKTWDDVYQLKSIIDLCLETENFDLLTKIFELDFDTNDLQVTWRLYVSFQSIYIQSCKNNQQVIQYVTELLKTNELAQRILLQLFVEEQKLQGYYGDWLLASSEDLVEDMTVFKHVMLCQRAFENKDIASAKMYLEKSKCAFYLKPEWMHPNLKGRIAAWDYILWENKSTFSEFYEGLNDFTEKVAFLVFFYRLLEVYHGDIQEFDEIAKFEVNEQLFSLSFPEKHNLNKIYILKALYYLQRGNKVKSRDYIAKLNLRYTYSGDNRWVDEQAAKIRSLC
jgi:hypothetical protein